MPIALITNTSAVALEEVVIATLFPVVSSPCRPTPQVFRVAQKSRPRHAPVTRCETASPECHKTRASLFEHLPFRFDAMFAFDQRTERRRVARGANFIDTSSNCHTRANASSRRHGTLH